jgi:hypothetical protein
MALRRRPNLTIDILVRYVWEALVILLVFLAIVLPDRNKKRVLITTMAFGAPVVMLSFARELAREIDHQAEPHPFFLVLCASFLLAIVMTSYMSYMLARHQLMPEDWTAVQKHKRLTHVLILLFIASFGLSLLNKP